jgi:hypothetical protein
MHALQGKEDQGNWVFEKADKEADKAGQEASEGEEADHSFIPLSPSAELLDWESDLDNGKVCICPFYLLCLVHNLTELCQLLRKQRCMARTSKGTIRQTSEGSLESL